jgi:hypothetical protein
MISRVSLGSETSKKYGFFFRFEEEDFASFSLQPKTDGAGLTLISFLQPRIREKSTSLSTASSSSSFKDIKCLYFAKFQNKYGVTKCSITQYGILRL